VKPTQVEVVSRPQIPAERLLEGQIVIKRTPRAGPVSVAVARPGRSEP
jgi:hypothetical protein